MKHLKLASALAVIVLTACAASPSDSEPTVGEPVVGSAESISPGERVLGVIEFYGEPVRVEVPGSVRRGRPFVITIVTYGGGCINKGEAKVEVEALQAEVRPYDYDTAPTLPANGTCTADLRHYKHTVTLNFEKTGTAEIVFHGEKEDSSGVTQISVTRTLEVR